MYSTIREGEREESGRERGVGGGREEGIGEIMKAHYSFLSCLTHSMSHQM